MDINHFIRSRRTIKPDKFTDEIIDDQVIKEILENANWAPTHGHTEPWYFVVFSGKGRERLGQFQADLYKEVTPEAEYKGKKYHKLLNNPQKASHVIGIGMKRGDKPHKIPVVEEIEATACAVQNMWLTASARGIAGYWNSGGMTYHPRMKELFGLTQKEDQVLGFLYLGYPAIDWPEGKRNSSIEAKTRWIES